MRAKKHIFGLLFLLFIQAATSINFKHYGIMEGLSQISVLSIYQDEFGRMWFGTEEGINCYDGNNIHSYKSIQSNNYDQPPLNYSIGIHAFPITGDRKGSVYFVSGNSKLLRLNLRTESFEELIPEGVSTVNYSAGKIWVGVRDSIIIWNQESREKKFVLQAGNASIIKIVVDSANRLWIGTRRGLYCKEGNSPVQLVIPEEDIYEIFEDSKQNLWIGTKENGMYKRNTNGAFVKFIHDPNRSNSVSDNQVRSFQEDKNGKIWIGTFLGLNEYDPSTGRFIVYQQDNLAGSLAHSSVFSIYKDSQGGFWVGTYYGGVHYFNQETDLFTYYSSNLNRRDCISYSFVGHMVEDNDQNIWICTEGGGLNFFDRKTKKFTHFLPNESDNSIAHNNLKNIVYSSQTNKLYIGTHTGGISIYDISRKQFRNITSLYPVNQPELDDNVISNLELYEDSLLIVMTRKCLLKVSLKTMQITRLFSQNYVGSTFLIDSGNYIWIIGGGTLQRIHMKDEKDYRIFNLQGQFGQIQITDIFESSKGKVYFATRGAGLLQFREEPVSFMAYTAEKRQLLSNYCYDIDETSKGDLVISGDKGITFFSPGKENFRALELGSALPISGINYGCGVLACRDGEVFVGGIDGLTSFMEEALDIPERKYNLYFSSLVVNNRAVHPNPWGILKEAVPFTKEIKLNHNQNNLIFTFATNNYARDLVVPLYEYMLEGNDKTWIENKDHKIAYTNLPPGKYRLLVREKLKTSQSNPQQISMGIVIKAPFYATHFAFALYILLFLAIVYSFIRFKNAEIVLNANLEFERKEKIRIEELNQEKLQFFSNVSHEFRTPLTLIISQIDQMIKSGSLPPSTYNKLLKIQRNSHQMSQLVNELLDFRKMEGGHLRLNLSEVDLITFLDEIYSRFVEVAGERGIAYKFLHPEHAILCWLDTVQMQKVFLNLLSNAFKFTKENGQIILLAEESKDDIFIKIIDDGVGIRKEDLEKIFDIFYQSRPVVGKQPIGSGGSGIGLSLSKSIVELHHGAIHAESKIGYGSVFKVQLKKGKEHFKQDDYRFDNEPAPLVEETLLDFHVKAKVKNEAGDVPFIPEQETYTDYTILIVEDNEELLQVLCGLFLPLYRVTTARNGIEGLNKALELQPDIILSDIMMPEMSGDEMCSRIKNNFHLCHIPVVLLTALTSQDQKVRGFQQGADAYIVKPFDSKVLLATCGALIKNRQLLQTKLSKQENIDIKLLADNPIDRDFLDQVNQIFTTNLSNPDFDMVILAKTLGLSRSSLYSKFKVLTRGTPNDFFLLFRLKYAVRLLKEHPEMQISEIADYTGFTSPRYFSKCFKDYFLVTPQEYRKKKL